MARTAALIDFLGVEKDIAEKGDAVTPAAELPLGDNLPPFANSNRSSTSASAAVWSAQPYPAAFMPPLSAPTPAVLVSRPAENADCRMSPLTIFYNGVVSVFDMSPEKAEVLMWLARAATGGYCHRDGTPIGELLPLARRKSLERFLEKRKERLTTAPAAYHKASEVDPKGKKIIKRKVRWNDKLKLKSDGTKMPPN